MTNGSRYPPLVFPTFVLLYPLEVIKLIGGQSTILFKWIVIIRLVNTIRGVPTTPIISIGSPELLLKFLPIKTPFDPWPKFATNPISSPPLTKFVLGTIVSFPIVGITTLSGWRTFIPTCYFQISTTSIFDTLGEVDVIQIWWCPILWLPIGILYGAKYGCECTSNTLLSNWIDGQICRLCGRNWLTPNSRLLNLFWIVGIPSSYSYDWSINASTTFCNSACLTMLALMWKGIKGQSMIGCPSFSQNAHLLKIIWLPPNPHQYWCFLPPSLPLVHNNLEM